jgi:hypothetical protein
MRPVLRAPTETFNAEYVQLDRGISFLSAIAQLLQFLTPTMQLYITFCF